MFWYLLLMLFSPLYLMFGLVFRSEQARLVLALYQQVLILQRQLGKRPSLAPIERFALVLTSLLLGKKKMTEALMIVKPETLVGWHRAIVRRHWRFRTTRQPGRPPEMEQLVLQIARENRWMGYGKIAGEMRKLGVRPLRAQQRGSHPGKAWTHARAAPQCGPELVDVPRPLRAVHLGQ